MIIYLPSYHSKPVWVYCVEHKFFFPHVSSVFGLYNESQLGPMLFGPQQLLSYMLYLCYNLYIAVQKFREVRFFIALMLTKVAFN